MTQSLFVVFVVAMCALAGPAAAQREKPAARTAAASTQPVNLNTASAVQLSDLPGIGIKTAELIVQYREKNGPFKKIEEVMNVRGVGERSFLRIKDRLVVTVPKGE